MFFWVVIREGVTGAETLAVVFVSSLAQKLRSSQSRDDITSRVT